MPLSLPSTSPLSSTTFRYVVLGAGCAGLSLVWYLLEHGIQDPILLLDRRTAFPDDRTWCFWDTTPTPFTALATHRWERWTVRAQGREANCHASQTPYVHLRASDFYAAILKRIAAHSNVHLCTGTQVHSWRAAAGTVQVTTDAGDFHGDVLIDAQGVPARPRHSHDEANTVGFRQGFVGQCVQTHQDCFDLTCASLMDWDLPQPPGALRFAYVLPFSPRRALVEITDLISDTEPAPLPEPQAVSCYLQSRFSVRDFAVERTESGCIPMTSSRLPQQSGPRVFHLGTAGGAVRPSSGYAFLRIQRSARTLAHALVHGTTNHLPALDPPRRRFLDRVFLRVLRDSPGSVPTAFQALFARVPPPTLVRFLSDQSTLQEEYQIVRALPFTPFARAALQSLTP